jgi:predicted RNA-binding Zn ribbon-like protein
MVRSATEAGSCGSDHRFEFTGGALCLDFINTLGDRPRGLCELLRSHGDLLRWAEEAGILDRADAQRLARRASRRRHEAEAVLEVALSLRETLFRIFDSGRTGNRPPARDLEILNGFLGWALASSRLSLEGEGLQWAWEGLVTTPDGLLWPVIRSAADLLTSEQSARVKKCDSEVCSWLFIDRRRGGRRRWCDMKSCGNRAKAKRHYRRKKSGAGDGSGCSPTSAES